MTSFENSKIRELPILIVGNEKGIGRILTDTMLLIDQCYDTVVMKRSSRDLQYHLELYCGIHDLSMTDADINMHRVKKTYKLNDGREYRRRLH